MKESTYKTYDELPLFLNAQTVAKVLGISLPSSYELMHEQASITFTGYFSRNTAVSVIFQILF